MRDGWRVRLIYLALPNVEMSKLRVAEQVTHEGHAILILQSDKSKYYLKDFLLVNQENNTCLIHLSMHRRINMEITF